MTSHDDSDLPAPGRPVVLEPLAPGLWTLILGLCVAVLAPLFGFLVGTTFGAGTGAEMMSPLHLGLFVGVVIGGLGVAVAISGGWRLLRRSHEDQATSESDPD
ncbi:hypothetical protein ACQBAU_13860 [Propionibacteriaceae bacterium Y2011]